MGKFNDLIDMTVSFAEKFSRGWLDATYLDLFLEMEKKGFLLSRDLKEYSTSVADAVIAFQKSLLNTNGLEGKAAEINAKVIEYMKSSNGKIDLAAWEKFSLEMKKTYAGLSKESMDYMKKAMEAVTSIYSFEIW
ncbi:MAG: hypothetical protein H7844_10235 [Nitrospirae bacterium YQR-1]